MNPGTYNKLGDNNYNAIAVITKEIESEDPEGRTFIFKLIYLRKQRIYLNHFAQRNIVNYHRNKTTINVIELTEVRKCLIGKLRMNKCH